MARTPARSALPRRAALLVAAASTLLSACVGENERLTVGDDVELEIFSNDRPGILPEGSLHPTTDPVAALPAFPEGEKSLTGIDRSNWSSNTFLVPVDGTGHRPTYAIDLQLKNTTARQRGEYPTALTALELDGGYTDEQFVESIDSPIVVLAGAIAVPFRLFFEPQTRVDWSPGWNYQRWPSAKERATASHESPPPLIEVISPPPAELSPIPTSTDPSPERRTPPEPAPESPPADAPPAEIAPPASTEPAPEPAPQPAPQPAPESPT